MAVTKGEASTLYRLAAFAIEDRVDFRFVEHDYTGPSTLMGDALVAFSKDIKPRARGQSDFFNQVYAHMKAALEQLHHAELTRPKTGDADTGTIFDLIDALAVSTAGVVEDHRRLIQLPFWDWDSQEKVTWLKDGKSVEGFDFVDVICGIVRVLSPDTDMRALREKIFVVNDVTACAAAEYNMRSRDGLSKPHDFVFIKVHNGVNVGVIEEGMAFTKNGHTEMGHIYPNYHPLDVELNFAGICWFHGNCLEGMISLQSIRERARLTRRAQQKTVPAWAAVLERLEHESGYAELKATALFKEIVGTSPGRGRRSQAGTELGIDLAAHYVAQIVHPLMLSPLLPDQIAIGGRFATEAVVDRVRDKIQAMTRGYPFRTNAATRTALQTYIQRSKVEDSGTIEVTGALELARGRSKLVSALPREGRRLRPASASPTMEGKLLLLNSRTPAG